MAYTGKRYRTGKNPRRGVTDLQQRIIDQARARVLGLSHGGRILAKEAIDLLKASMLETQLEKAKASKAKVQLLRERGKNEAANTPQDTGKGFTYIQQLEQRGATAMRNLKLANETIEAKTVENRQLATELQELKEEILLIRSEAAAGRFDWLEERSAPGQGDGGLEIDGGEEYDPDLDPLDSKGYPKGQSPAEITERDRILREQRRVEAEARQKERDEKRAAEEAEKARVIQEAEERDAALRAQEAEARRIAAEQRSSAMPDDDDEDAEGPLHIPPEYNFPGGLEID